VLITVVWTIMLLSLLAASLGSRQVFALSLVQRVEQDLQAFYIATAAVQQAITLLQQEVFPKADGFSDPWANNQAAFADRVFDPGTYTIGDTVIQGGVPSMRYGLVDEERRLNLNTVSATIIARLLEQVGQMREDEARTVADSIVDWRDEDQEAGERGAEDFYYLGLDRAYECKDAPFENVEELRLIRGMTPEVYDRVAPFVTVYGSGGVNVNTAGVEVLRALGFTEEGVNGVVFFRAGEDNAEGTADDRVVVALTALVMELGAYLPKEDLNQVTQLLQDGVLTVDAQAFRMTIEARVADGKHPLRVEAVVTRDGDIALWRES